MARFSHQTPRPVFPPNPNRYGRVIFATTTGLVLSSAQFSADPNGSIAAGLLKALQDVYSDIPGVLPVLEGPLVDAARYEMIVTVGPRKDDQVNLHFASGLTLSQVVTFIARHLSRLRAQILRLPQPGSEATELNEKEAEEALKLVNPDLDPWAGARD